MPTNATTEGQWILDRATRLLDQHRILAWDMDSTLIDGPHSEFLRAYISARPDKHHHVVTFRDRRWAEVIPLELAALGLDPARIASVESCPEHLHDLHMAGLTRPTRQTRAASYEFVRWKGRVARQLGCTVLIDDAEEWVIEGCREFGIEFVHSHQLRL